MDTSGTQLPVSKLNTLPPNFFQTYSANNFSDLFDQEDTFIFTVCYLIADVY